MSNVKLQYSMPQSGQSTMVQHHEISKDAKIMRMFVVMSQYVDL